MSAYLFIFISPLFPVKRLFIHPCILWTILHGASASNVTYIYLVAYFLKTAPCLKRLRLQRRNEIEFSLCKKCCMSTKLGLPCGGVLGHQANMDTSVVLLSSLPNAGPSGIRHAHQRRNEIYSGSSMPWGKPDYLQ